jgi:hypothetical protein
MTMFDRARGCVTAVVLACAAAAGGCSAGDVELNGSVFDYLGVGSKSQTANRDNKVPERQALVLPPNLERLPEPGSGTVAAAAAEAMPVDPEQKRVAVASQAEKNHREYCEMALQRAKVNKDYSPVVGPLGNCNKSVLDVMTVQSPIEVTTGSNPPAKAKP